MNVVRVLVIAAALFVAWVTGMWSVVVILRRFYPITFHVLESELKARDKEKENQA